MRQKRGPSLSTYSILIAGLVACNIDSRPAITTPPAGLVEAGFAHLFSNNGSAFQSFVAAYCIGLGSGRDLRDPDAALLQSFGGSTPAVRPASACRIGVNVTEIASGQRALLFNFGELSCSSASACTFRGGYYEGNLSASARLYSAKYVDGRWSISVNPVAKAMS